MKASFIDRVNDRMADSARYLGPVLLLLGVLGMIASVVMYLWK